MGVRGPRRGERLASKAAKPWWTRYPLFPKWRKTCSITRVELLWAVQTIRSSEVPALIKQDIVHQVIERTGLPRTKAEAAVDTVFEGLKAGPGGRRAHRVARVRRLQRARPQNRHRPQSAHRHRGQHHAGQGGAFQARQGTARAGRQRPQRPVSQAAATPGSAAPQRGVCRGRHRQNRGWNLSVDRGCIPSLAVELGWLLSPPAPLAPHISLCIHIHHHIPSRHIRHVCVGQHPAQRSIQSLARGGLSESNENGRCP